MSLGMTRGVTREFEEDMVRLGCLVVGREWRGETGKGGSVGE